MNPMDLWQMSERQYQALTGADPVGIFEHCSPMQYAHMSKRSQAHYTAGQDAARSRAAGARQTWREGVLAAYQAGAFTLDTPGVHDDARALIKHTQQQAVEADLYARYDAAQAAAHIRADQPPAVGDRLWIVIYARYATITRVNKNTLTLRGDDGGTYRQVSPRCCAWRNYTEIRAEFIAAEPRPDWAEYLLNRRNR